MLCRDEDEVRQKAKELGLVEGIVDQAMAAKVRPAVHHAMPDRGRLGLFAVCEKRPDACDRIPLGSEIRRFGNQ